MERLFKKTEFGEFNMKIGENFNQIGEIPKGELVIKFPGTDLKLVCKKGKAFLSNTGIGYVSLPVRDAYCAENGEPEGLFGTLGIILAEQINNPSSKHLLRKRLALGDFSLFYSQTRKGIEVLCVPGISENNEIDTKNIPRMSIAAYSTTNGIPSAEEVYVLHMKVVGKEKLITNKSILEKEVLHLIPKVNRFYEKALQIMNESIF
jgi:hypothetical protein